MARENAEKLASESGGLDEHGNLKGRGE